MKLTNWVMYLCLLLLSSKATAEVLVVKVVEPFANMHTGPASEYPVFYVVEKGEQIQVLKKRTGWYKIQTTSAKLGWISAKSLAQTLNLDDSQVVLFRGDFTGYRHRTWEFGVFAGRLNEVNSLSVSAAYVWTENIVTELSVSQALGDFSENRLWLARFQHFTFPEWRLSPYLTLGAGQIQTSPRATLVQSGGETRTNDLLEAGLGLRFYLHRNFVTRLEFKHLTALTERDQLEEINEWKLGISVFF